MVTRAREATAPRVALAAEDERTAGQVAVVARVRGFPVERLSLDAAVEAPVGAIAFAPAAPPDAARAARLAPLCRRAAESRRPVVLLAAFERVRGRAAEERAAALAYLRTHGAIVAEDPDVWFETAVLVAAFGAPSGPRTAVVAPPGGWLHLAATALALEEEARGGLRPAIEAGPPQEALGRATPTDVALVDGELVVPSAPERVGRTLVVPVVARAESLPPDRPALVGLRAAIAAAALAGRHSERLAQGLGAAPPADAKKLKVDRERAQKALAQAGERLGDHETKLLLSAYGVPVTRQGVASTPSAAVRIAQTCGFPVEVKPWDPAVTPEREGGPVVTGVKNPPDVRRAFAAAATAAGLAVGVPVIVRVTPPQGREVAARIERVSELGWTVLLDLPGASRPAAAPAPLRRLDAEELAAALESSRAADAPPDRAALAELLLRASFAAVDHEGEIESVALGRVVVAPRGGGAVVVDGRVKLRKPRRGAAQAPL